jgi:peptidoglycan/LPS O-acetylase OafA/YrhL
MLSKSAFPFSPREILINALIVPRWPTLTRSIDGIVWTLEIEIFFYATCSLLMYHIRKFDRRIFLLPALVFPLALLFAFQGGVLIRIGMPVYALANWASTMLVYVCFMACGVAFYYHYHDHLSHIGLFKVQAFLLVVFVTCMRVGVLAIQGWTAPICFLVAYSVFTLGYLARERVTALPYWGCRPIYWLADISYPLYVVHAVLGYTILVHALQSGVPAWAALAIALTVILTLAAFVHLSVELPSQSYGKILAEKLRLARDLSAQRDSAAISRLNVATTSDTGPNSIMRPSQR